MAEENGNANVSLTVVGGGLVGSLQAIMLAQRGFRVDLYEGRPDIRTEEHASGRSINLALSFRGREALKAVGLEEVVVETAIPMYGRMIHSLSGKMSSLPYGKGEQCINSVDRRKLNMLLLSNAEQNPNITLHFEQRLTRANLDEKTLVFQETREEKTVKTDFIFGCDGAHSTVRRQMMRWGRLNYSQEYIEHGYKELTMLPDANGDFKLPPNYLHIWPRNKFMMIALPNQDHTFTLTLFMPFKVFKSIETKGDLLEFFDNHFPDSVEKIGPERLVQDYFHNPTGRLISVKCYPHFMAGSTVILGDAAHAVVPFYGQGMNAGFEDCLVFCEFLQQFDNDLHKAALEYSNTRWKDNYAIADLSMYNYLEMRSHVTSRIFVLRKYVDNALHALLPRIFIPLYTMVAFTRIPYHKAVERSRWQKKAIDRALLLLGIVSLGLLGYVAIKWSGLGVALKYRILPCVVECVVKKYVQ